MNGSVSDVHVFAASGGEVKDVDADAGGGAATPHVDGGLLPPDPTAASGQDDSKGQLILLFRHYYKGLKSFLIF